MYKAKNSSSFKKLALRPKNAECRMLYDNFEAVLRNRKFRFRLPYSDHKKTPFSTKFL